MGFNSVGSPWANETLERNPVVPAYASAANPQFKGPTLWVDDITYSTPSQQSPPSRGGHVA